ncbi:MAG: hypothetical protein H6510_15740 [Acidobacteria bacterium]|nr:hypothetical protein [Acidobacteriota bacterium]MCB9399264.1 hypothetical protein [Acidobacteriota bacterium]
MGRVFLLPGMGADARMYGSDYDELNPVRCTWPIGAFADLQAVAHEMIQRYQIRSGDWLIGSSMGGMVAQEMADLIPNCPVILLGSGIHASELRRYLFWLKPLARPPVLGFFQKILWPVGLFGRMLYTSDTTFLTQMCHACLEWQGAKSGHVLRLHGKMDIMIRATSPHKRLWGGHLIALSRSKRCVAAIQACMAQSPS